METLLSYANILFWGVVLLLFIIAGIFALFATTGDSLFKFVIRDYPLAQIAVRWCLLAAIALCLFADPFDGTLPVILRILLMYVMAAIGYFWMLSVWAILLLTLRILRRIIIWACTVDSD